MAKGRIVKIILDTNWYVSASVNRRSRRHLYKILTSPKLRIFYSKELLQEYQEVISRKRFQKTISETQIIRFLSLVLPKLTSTTITTAVRLGRDAKDNYLLAMALECNADYLVSGDADLLVLKQIGNTKIVKMSEFQSLFFY